MSQLFFATNTSESKKYSRLTQLKRLRRLYQGIYTDDVVTPAEDIVLNNWLVITAYLAPQAILAYRTAIELTPYCHDNQRYIFMIGNYYRTIKLPGLNIKISKGDTELATEAILPNLKRTELARSLLENIQLKTSSQTQFQKALAIDEIELILAKELRARGESALNELRDKCKIIAEDLGYPHAYIKLNDLFSALLTTAKTPLVSTYAKSVAAREPFDENRVKCFELLMLYLKKCIFKDRSYSYQKKSFLNLAFFEAYFSNYIEGTEFIIDEAEDIVFKREEVNNRHRDSHDILANYLMSSNYSELTKTPQSSQELLELLKQRHATLMQARPDKNPGCFKSHPNRAGNTYFVDPADVTGTLKHAFTYYELLKPGIERALYLHYVITEIHPFSDGNGRLSRIMMNAELVSADQFKIIIPTVHRDNYLNGLRLVSRDHYFKTYCQVMDQAQAYTEQIPWVDYAAARQRLETDFADKLPDDGLPIFNRVLRTLQLSEFA